MESNNSGYASRSPHSAFSSSLRRKDDQAPPLPPGQRRAFRRLHAQQQFMPLLLLTLALTLLIVIATGYVAARANATSSAEATARTNALLAREVVSERGQFPAIANTQLVASTGTTNYSLVNDTWVVDHVRQLTGDQAVIYQLIATDTSPSSLRAVSSNMHRTDAQGNPIANTRATGEPMPANAQNAIFGACGQVTDNTACYSDFSGEVTIAGVSYVAGFEPLLDQRRQLVGAVGVLTPLDNVLAPPKQLAIVLLLMGLLVGLVALVIGTWLASRTPNRLLTQLDGQLDVMAGAATELGRLAHQQQFRLQRQQRTARQVGEHSRRLEALASAMDNGQTALQQTTTAIWAEMSQPGLATNAAVALRLAREAAVRASEVGTTGDETRTHARHVITLMNQVIAEGRALAQEGQAAESHANELATTLDRMETDLGEQLVPRRYDLGSTPLIRRLTDASHRIREMLQPNGAPSTHPRKASVSRPMHDRGGPMSATRPRLSGLPPHNAPGRSPSTSFRGSELWG
ncbi:MAG TPA: cache domain-containing protein, partial [Ktedonobacterales bacterium]